MRLFMLAFTAISLVASSAIAQVRVESDEAAALMRPLPITVDGETRTAAVLDSVLVQRAEVAEVVRLQAATTASFPLGGEARDMSLPAGAELFRVAFRSNANLRGYCSPDTIHTQPDPRRPARVGRICLSDADNDGAFDRVWYMAVPAGAGGRADGTWETYPYTRLAGGQVYAVEGETLAAPARYAAVTSHGIAPATLEIRHVRWGRSMAFQLRSREGEELTDISTEVVGSQPIDPANEYPRLLRMHGAEVEILSRREDGAITYRVRRGFSESEPLQLVNNPPPAPPPPLPPRPR